MRSLRGKVINDIHCLSYFYYLHLFPNIRHGIIIRTLVFPKICFLSRLNSWQDLLYSARKRKAVMRIKVDSNKVICPDFGRNVLYRCRDDHDELPLVDPYTNLSQCQLQELPCLRLVLLCLGFIIHFIESARTSLLFTNLDPLLFKTFQVISYIHVRLEAII